MGGIETAVISTGMGVRNLLDAQNQVRADRNDVKRQRKFNLQNKKNLLDEQLATRRASLGALGIGSSPSSLAASGRLIDEAYRGMTEDEADARSKLKTLSRRKNAEIFNSTIGFASKFIK